MHCSAITLTRDETRNSPIARARGDSKWSGQTNRRFTNIPVLRIVCAYPRDLSNRKIVQERDARSEDLAQKIFCCNPQPGLFPDEGL